MSVFDPQTFASQTFTESNDTTSVPVPQGEWLGDITKSEIVTWSSKDGTKAGLKCVLTINLTDPGVKEVTGRDTNSVRYDMMLDLTPEGGLDFGKGKNVNLGRAREACGINKKGQPFNFDMFAGRPVRARVKHSEWNGRLMANVSDIAAA